MTKQSRRERDEEYLRDFADRIIAHIKKGTAPWQKPWRAGHVFLPRNAASKKRYSGSNSVDLLETAISRGYEDPRWGTVNQINARGGQVRKGERGSKVVFSGMVRVPEKDDSGRPVKDKEGKQKYKYIGGRRWRQYTVFNVEQTKNTKLWSLDEVMVPEWQAHRRAEIVMERQHCEVAIRHKLGDRAVYFLRKDEVVLPIRRQFPIAHDYYLTALHELAHATGHKKRLNRKTLYQGTFGSPSYAREELRAEIGAMMTGEVVGIGHKPQDGAAYVKSWVKVLEDDPWEIRLAASDAQRIMDYLTERPRVRGALDQEQVRPAPPT